MIGVVDWRNSSEINGLRLSATRNEGNPSTSFTLPVPALAFAALPIAAGVADRIWQIGDLLSQ